MAGVLARVRGAAIPGFEPAGTFYVNREPFAAEESTADLLAKLVALGFEIANHTRDHLALGTLTPEEVQQQLVLENRVIHDFLPEAEIVTMALPHGSLPTQPALALEGVWDGESYRFAGVLLVGAEPAPSPFSSAFEPRPSRGCARLPTRRWKTDRQTGSTGCARNPELRFVSDGDPSQITVPAGREAEVAERYSGA